MVIGAKLLEWFIGIGVDDSTLDSGLRSAREKVTRTMGDAGKKAGQEAAKGYADEVAKSKGVPGGGGAGRGGGGFDAGGGSGMGGAAGFLSGFGLIQAFSGLVGLIGRGVERYAQEVKYQESQFDLINSQLSASDSAALKTAHENSKRLAKEVADAEQVDRALNAGMGGMGPGSAFRAIKNYFAPVYAPELETGKRAAELEEQKRVENDILQNAKVRREIFNQRVSANTTSSSLDSIAFDIQQFVRMNTLLGRK